MTNALATQPPLKLMIFDSSDTKTNIKRIRAGISEDVNKIIDLVLPDELEESEFDVPLGLTHTWFGGGLLYRLLGRVDDHKGFKTWEDALSWLVHYEGKRPIGEIQVWGHGSPGRSWMLEDRALEPKMLEDPKFSVLFKQLKDRLAPDAHIWFRNCSVFAGVRGHVFAREFSDFFNCRISAHTHIIGFWQAGLHTAVPGLEPHWSLKEGNGGRDVSKYSSPNRITCLHGEVPRGW